jgi:hypothetical protein
MRPAYCYAGWSTFDLTEAKIHFTEGRLIACIPSKWEKITENKVTLQTGKGGTMDVHQYRILEWDEVEIASNPLRSAVKPD